MDYTINSTINKSVESAQRIKGLALLTNKIGDKILEDLDEQREQLQHINHITI